MCWQDTIQTCQWLQWYQGPCVLHASTRQWSPAHRSRSSVSASGSCFCCKTRRAGNLCHGHHISFSQFKLACKRVQGIQKEQLQKTYETILRNISNGKKCLEKKCPSACTFTFTLLDDDPLVRSLHTWPTSTTQTDAYLVVKIFAT